MPSIYAYYCIANTDINPFVYLTNCYMFLVLTTSQSFTSKGSPTILKSCTFSADVAALARVDVLNKVVLAHVPRVSRIPAHATNLLMFAHICACGWVGMHMWM